MASGSCVCFLLKTPAPLRSRLQGCRGQWRLGLGVSTSEATSLRPMGVLSPWLGSWSFVNHQGGNLRVPRWLVGGHREEQGSEPGTFVPFLRSLLTAQDNQPLLGLLCQPRGGMTVSESVHSTHVELRAQGDGGWAGGGHFSRPQSP